MAELATQGITEYIVLALGGGAYYNAVTVATQQAGGFSDTQRAILERVFALFALHIERHMRSALPATCSTPTWARRPAARCCAAQSIAARANAYTPHLGI